MSGTHWPLVRALISLDPRWDVYRVGADQVVFKLRSVVLVCSVTDMEMIAPSVAAALADLMTSLVQVEFGARLAARLDPTQDLGFVVDVLGAVVH